tara:strand:+ start:1232 stop:2197 length:966 start_codon:yes stop_codon:yes gene_type:complete
LKYLRSGLLFFVGIYTLYFVTDLLLEDVSEIKEATSSLPLEHILIGFLIYMLSHIFRVLRLVVLNSNPALNIKSLWSAQIKANGVNLIIPFRMGEAYRLIAFKRFFGSYSNSFSILLCERFLDIILITFFLILSIYFSDLNLEFLINLMYLSIFILSIIFFIYFSLDEFLIIIHNIFVGKDTTSINLNIVKISGKLLKILQNTKTIFSSKLTTCLSITLIIWALEVLVFYFLLSILDLSNFIILFLAVSVALSSLLPNGPAGYGGVQLAFYIVGLSFGIEELVLYSFVYNIYIFGAAIVIAGLLFFVEFFSTSLGKKYESK